jgi:hypothetical protein
MTNGAGECALSMIMKALPSLVFNHGVGLLGDPILAAAFFVGIHTAKYAQISVTTTASVRREKRVRFI